jgi:hypothetical protein
MVQFATLGCSQRMNIFTTEHPLNADRKPGLLSYFFGVLLIAVLVCPLIAVGFWVSDDNGGSTGGYTPAPFWMDLLAAAVVCAFFAFVGAGVIMLFVLLFRSKNPSQFFFAHNCFQWQFRW